MIPGVEIDKVPSSYTRLGIERAIDHWKFYDDPWFRSRSKDPSQNQGLTLLLSCLSPEQQESFMQYGYFLVQGSHGGIYMLTDTSGRNIARIRGPSTQSFCIISDPVPIPLYDQLLAKALLVSSNEKMFLETAY